MRIDHFIASSAASFDKLQLSRCFDTLSLGVIHTGLQLPASFALRPSSMLI